MERERERLQIHVDCGTGEEVEREKEREREGRGRERVRGRGERGATRETKESVHILRLPIGNKGWEIVMVLYTLIVIGKARAWRSSSLLL